MEVAGLWCIEAGCQLESFALEELESRNLLGDAFKEACCFAWGIVESGSLQKE